MIPSRTFFRLLAPATGITLFAAATQATTVKHAGIDELCHKAGRIFSGRVVRIEPKTIAIGGGLLPAIEYTLAVDESFKGTVETTKGIRLARVRMLGEFPAVDGDGIRRLASITGLPRLTVDERYLLLITRPGRSGLSTTVGLGQGCFHLTGEAGDVMAENEFHNIGLFTTARQTPRLTTESGGQVPGARGPIAYVDLAAAIRGALAAGPPRAP
ncbi:MAG: hypothetical protein ACE5IK_07555 [Acidobacteriota bacterium]